MDIRLFVGPSLSYTYHLLGVHSADKKKPRDSIYTETVREILFLSSYGTTKKICHLIMDFLWPNSNKENDQFQ
jgi:hypothetical protein